MHPYDGRVTSNFLVQAINGEDITVYGEGLQTRSFCYVDDLIDGLIRLMNQTETIGPVNIGNPGEFTIKQLAELAIKTTGSSSKIIYQPLPGDDPKQRRPDITKAKKCDALQRRDACQRDARSRADVPRAREIDDAARRRLRTPPTCTHDALLLLCDHPSAPPCAMAAHDARALAGISNGSPRSP